MQSYRTVATRFRHPVNVALHTNAPLGVRIANAVTGFMGSWRFIILQTIVVVVWVAGNIYLLFHFDPYPFIFLTVRDRATLEHAADEAEDADTKDADIVARLTRLEALLTELKGSPPQA